MLMLVKINSFLGKKNIYFPLEDALKNIKKTWMGEGGMVNQGLTMYIMCQPTKIYIYVPGGH